MKWNNQEKQILIDNYYENGLSWCCKKLDRSKNSVALMAKRLGVYHKSMDGVKNDDEFLINNYKIYGPDYCAKELKRSKPQIIKRACKLKLNQNHRWTSKEIEVIKENYPKYGSVICGKLLNLDSNIVIAKANKLKIKLNDKTSKKIKKEAMIAFSDKRDYETFNVNPEQFLNIKTPEVAYTLGFIWADGHVRQVKNENSIRININTKDFYELKKVFDETGSWGYYHYIRNEKYESTTITTNNRPIVDFMVENDYKKKSTVSPFKILSKLEECLLPYFLRGLSDGDGCFYVGKNSKSFVIVGTYEQDWSFLLNMFSKFNIKRVENKKGHKHSIAILTKKESIIEWGDYIYKNYKNENIGFERKYKKFLQIKNEK